MDYDEVIVVGGGLVGSLLALFLCRRNIKVKIYEKREDLRQQPPSAYAGKSINLALSFRGLEALKKVNLESEILKECTAMYQRMIHVNDQDSTTLKQPYGLYGESINSVDRRMLNIQLLNECEKKYANLISFHFYHELISIDFERKACTFLNENNEKISVKAGAIIGTDGAYSRVRKEMSKILRMNINQYYIEHGYKELFVPPTEGGYKQLPSDCLHIWPRKDSGMMIALPNKDGSFTATCFFPFDLFDKLSKLDADNLFEFFEQNYKEVASSIGKSLLVETFKHNSTGSLVTVKCSPYNYKDFCLLLGDSAHAMVPFYGQGMNAGFEDVLILDELIDRHGSLPLAIECFSAERVKDGHTIADLAHLNYKEMREDVLSPFFRIQRFVLNKFLHPLFPTRIIPPYSLVSFSRFPYSQIPREVQRQKSVVNWLLSAGFLTLALSGAMITIKAIAFIRNAK